MEKVSRHSLRTVIIVLSNVYKIVKLHFQTFRGEPGPGLILYQLLKIMKSSVLPLVPFSIRKLRNVLYLLSKKCFRTLYLHSTLMR